MTTHNKLQDACKKCFDVVDIDVLSTHSTKNRDQLSSAFLWVYIHRLKFNIWQRGWGKIGLIRNGECVVSEVHIYGGTLRIIVSWDLVVVLPSYLRREWNVEQFDIDLIGPVRVIILYFHSLWISHTRDARGSWMLSGGVPADDIGPASEAIHVNVFWYIVSIIGTRHSWRIKMVFICNFSVRHYHTRWWYRREKCWWITCLFIIQEIKENRIKWNEMKIKENR